MYTIAFISILIAIVIIISFIVIQFLKLKLYKDIHNKENVSYIINLSGFMVTLIAVLISIFTIKQSNDDRNEQRAIDSTQQSTLYASKNFLDTLKRSFDTLNTSFKKLNFNVNNITGKLENIPTQIDNISGSFQSLNAISQKQYSIMFEQYKTAQNQIKEQEEEKLRELQKRPLLSVKGIECGTGYVPTLLYIENSGELGSVISKLIFQIPDNVRSETFSIEGLPSVTDIKDGFVSITTVNLGDIKEKRPNNYKINWQFFNPVSEVFDVKYKLYYWNRNNLDSTLGTIKMCNLTYK